MLRSFARWQLAMPSRRSYSAAMNVIPAEQWSSLEPLLRKHCPRLTPADLAEADRRVDLLTAKIQNRHWMDRIASRRLVLALMQQAGIQKIA